MCYKLGAAPQLIRHVRLVGEAADLLLSKIEQIGIKVDANFVRSGVVYMMQVKLSTRRS
jgi:hypothetical protein